MIKFKKLVGFAVLVAILTIAANFVMAYDSSYLYDRWWDIYYKDACSGSTWKPYAKYARFYLDEENGIKYIYNQQNVKIGWWFQNDGPVTFSLDFFDALQGEFGFSWASKIFEGQGEMILPCGFPYKYTDFLIVYVSNK